VDTWADHDQPPIVAGSVIRVDVEHLPKPTSRTKKTLWLWAAGPGLELDTCWRAYLRRFDIEHTFRFVKNTLGWTTPSLCNPEQADRWTWLVIVAYTHPASPQAWSKTSACPGNHNANPAGSPRTSPKRISTTTTNTGHPSQSAKIAETRPRTSQGQPS
jgi:hypothetical protein